MKNYFTITEAAEYLGVTRQAVYVSIKKRRIKAQIINRWWRIKNQDLIFWKENRFNHNHRRDAQGNYLFDNIKTFSTATAAKLISEKLDITFTEQRLYYLLRGGIIKHYLYGKTKIIKIEDIDKYVEQTKKINEIYNLA